MLLIYRSDMGLIKSTRKAGKIKAYGELSNSITTFPSNKASVITSGLSVNLIDGKTFLFSSFKYFFNSVISFIPSISIFFNFCSIFLTVSILVMVSIYKILDKVLVYLPKYIVLFFKLADFILLLINPKLI